MIAGLILSKEMSIKKFKVHNDSQLIVYQILGEYQAKHMIKYLNVVNMLKPQFEEFFIRQIPRNDNTHGDALATLWSVVEFKIAEVIPVLYLPNYRSLDSATTVLVSTLESRLT